MSANGIGRGRGWLNQKLQAAKENERPGGAPSPTTLLNSSSSVTQQQQQFQTTGSVYNSMMKGTNLSMTSATTTGTEHITSPIESSKYAPIITAINALDSSDDGIKLNQKLKHIANIWEMNCQNEKDVTDSFDDIYSKCLTDSEFASKVASMVSSSTFMLAEISNVKVRTLFVKKLETNYDIRKQLKFENPVSFRNNVKMLAEFYNKARLCDGSILKFLAEPVLHYLDMLLESAQPEDIQLFTAQLYKNGARLKEAFPVKMSETLNDVRLLLTSQTSFSVTSKLWLMLALDVAWNRFTVLPHDLQTFYQSLLGEKAMAEFQGSYSALSVQTSQTNRRLDNYQSDVSVLQVNRQSSPPSVEQPSCGGTEPQVQALDMSTNSNVSNSTTTSTSGYMASDSSGGMTSIGTWGAPPSKEKTPRPILGVGARLKMSKEGNASGGGGGDQPQRYQQQQHHHHHRHNESKQQDKSKDSGNSTSASAASLGWSNKHKNPNFTNWGTSGGGGGGDRPSHKNKGWEHDDRFENDYS